MVKDKLFANSDFRELVSSEIVVTNPIPKSKIIRIYEIRRDNLIERGKHDIAEQILEMITAIRSDDSSSENVIGVSFSMKKYYMLYFTENFEKLLGKIVGVKASDGYQNKQE